MTYVLISIPFLVCAFLLWLWGLNQQGSKTRDAKAKKLLRRRYLLSTGLVLAVLVTLTIIFDNLMILSGLVGYHPDNNAGIFIGVMPAEDLLYSVAVALVVCAVWPYAGTRVENNRR